MLIGWAGKQHYWVGDAMKTLYEKGLFDENDIEWFADKCFLEQAGEGA